MVLELFGPEFKDKLFEELVQLNIKALDEAKKKNIKTDHLGLYQRTSSFHRLGKDKA